MATTVQIEGTTQTAKIRSPLAVVALSIITFGIYLIFWWYFVNREMKDYGKSKNTDECGESPVVSLLALTLGWMIIVPPFVSIFKGFKRMNAANRLSGAGDGFDAGLGLLIWIFISPIAIYLFQANLNKVWEAGASPAQATGAPEALAQPPAAPAPAPENRLEGAPVESPEPSGGPEGQAESPEQRD